jgi:hypothetical protein
MKVLIVGCGAVGQVYALALQNAGVTLGLLDQPAVAQKLNWARDHGGLPLYQISNRHRKDPIRNCLKDFQVFANDVECRDFKPDQIWFTTPSQVYYSDWFHAFLRGVPSKTVVCFIPEGNRPEFMDEGMSDRVIFGGTTFMAWQGDLAGGGGKPEGVNFWRSPLGIPLAGTREACHEVGLLLKQAGFRVMLDKPGSHSQASITAVMTTFVAGLELSAWSLKSYRRNPWLGKAASACREAVMGQLSRDGFFIRTFLSKVVLSAGFSLAALLMPLMFPFEIEKYLKYHYTKTREQTVILLKLFIKDGVARGIPVTKLQYLLQVLLGTG